ncbi:hypothetical protein TH66_20110 [Carbonactinospora thermoautotrophica]|uniref:Uncharacterized protein n=1 Tax=Carbonactinospora thermoautotrophica TaxID=1469144 RepID=A0A132NEF2_9ACTN|nr:hypothetical protein TH66_20110 [Carbonactinospora thermoautotrophica]KWX08515.1 hypothetical protein TR74_14680 [Carbonactinospora thermoautotrophica]
MPRTGTRSRSGSAAASTGRTGCRSPGRCRGRWHRRDPPRRAAWSSARSPFPPPAPGVGLDAGPDLRVGFEQVRDEAGEQVSPLLVREQVLQRRVLDLRASADALQVLLQRGRGRREVGDVAVGALPRGDGHRASPVRPVPGLHTHVLRHRQPGSVQTPDAARIRRARCSRRHFIVDSLMIRSREGDGRGEAVKNVHAA